LELIFLLTVDLFSTHIGSAIPSRINGPFLALAQQETVIWTLNTPVNGLKQLSRKKNKHASKGDKAMSEYKAHQQAMREKTARLRALRLARDSANQAGAVERKRRPF
jgi:hypothetical protein